MNVNIAKRTLALLAALATLGMCFGAWALAEGEEPLPPDDGGAGAAEAAADAVTAPARHVLDTNVVDLGKVPEETATEKKCDFLLVVDVATGVLIHEKNISAEMPVGGAAVQLMTALVALDCLSPDDTILVSADVLERCPRSSAALGLAAGNQVLVSDLIVGMLYTGAVDAAYILADEVVKWEGVESIGALMAARADGLGMTNTDYSGSDGTGVRQVRSTAADQCELYMEALGNETLLSLLKPGAYQVQSKSAPWITGDTDEDAAERAAMVEMNENLPDKLVNHVGAAVPENRQYDVRLSSAVSCTVKPANKSGRYNIVFFHAVDSRSDMVIIMGSATNTAAVAPKPLINLTDIFNRRKIIDLIPYVEVAANGLTVEKSGQTINGWFLTAGHVLYGRQMASYDPDAKVQNTAGDFDLSKMAVVLKPETSTLVTNEDGSRSIQAKVLVNNAVEGNVLLSTAPRATQTEVSQNTNTLYTEDDVLPPEPTLMSQYGWVIIIAGVILLAMIMIVVGVLIRNRMERW